MLVNDRGGLLQFFAVITGGQYHVFHFGRGDIAAYNAEDIIAVIQVHVPFINPGMDIQR